MDKNIPVLDNEEVWVSKAIDDNNLKVRLNAPQNMWIDVITAILAQPTFDVKIGNMGYVFKNMIAKFVSSSDYYRVSTGVFNTIIRNNLELHELILNDVPLNMKKYFYGKDKPSLLEHMVPTSVIAKSLLALGNAPKREQISFILRNSGEVAIILRTEDKLLSKSKMPENWNFSDSYYARYLEAGVTLEEGIRVKRNDSIYR
jgi:hypothetical protein